MLSVRTVYVSQFATPNAQPKGNRLLGGYPKGAYLTRAPCHRGRVRPERLQVLRQVSIPGETRLIIPTQAVDFGDQKLLGW